MPSTKARAASGRTRATDNIARFSAMPEREQNAFRAGYVDPQIARVEASAVSPSTNKARMLITEKTGQEFPRLCGARPRRSDGNRIARAAYVRDGERSPWRVEDGRQSGRRRRHGAVRSDYHLQACARGKVVDALTWPPSRAG